MEWKKIASMDMEKFSSIPIHIMPWPGDSEGTFLPSTQTGQETILLKQTFLPSTQDSKNIY